MPSCREIFEAGSPPQIHGKFTTLPVDHDTKRPGRGLSTARHSQNGNPLDRVLSYGLMGNVSYRPVVTFIGIIADTDSLPFHSGRWEKRPLVRQY